MSNGKPMPMTDKVLHLLSDGRRHSVDELHELMKPSGRKAVHNIVYQIRIRLNRRGEDIVCVRRGYKSYYQHVRLLYDPYTGRV